PPSYDEWTNYGDTYLDAGVVFITMSNKIVRGKKPVVDYLFLNSDKDQFTLMTSCSFKTNTSTRAVGKAYWHDTKNGCVLTSGTCPRINYVFDYTSLDPTIAKIKFMMGTPEHP